MEIPTEEERKNRVRTTVYQPRPDLVIVSSEQIENWRSKTVGLYEEIENGLFSPQVSSSIRAALTLLLQCERALDDAWLLRGDEEGNPQGKLPPAIYNTKGNENTTSG